MRLYGLSEVEVQRAENGERKSYGSNRIKHLLDEAKFVSDSGPSYGADAE